MDDTFFIAILEEKGLKVARQDALGRVGMYLGEPQRRCF